MLIMLLSREYLYRDVHRVGSLSFYYLLLPNYYYGSYLSLAQCAQSRCRSLGSAWLYTRLKPDQRYVESDKCWVRQCGRKVNVNLRESVLPHHHSGGLLPLTHTNTRVTMTTPSHQTRQLQMLHEQVYSLEQTASSRASQGQLRGWVPARGCQLGHLQ